MLFEVLLQVLFSGFVSGFYLPIALGLSGIGEYFLYSDLFAKGDEFQIVKLLSIICDFRV